MGAPDRRGRHDTERPIMDGAGRRWCRSHLAGRMGSCRPRARRPPRCRAIASPHSALQPVLRQLSLADSKLRRLPRCAQRDLGSSADYALCPRFVISWVCATDAAQHRVAEQDLAPITASDLQVFGKPDAVPARPPWAGSGRLCGRQGVSAADQSARSCEEVRLEWRSRMRKAVVRE